MRWPPQDCDSSACQDPIQALKPSQGLEASFRQNPAFKKQNLDAVKLAISPREGKGVDLKMAEYFPFFTVTALWSDSNFGCI